LATRYIHSFPTRRSSDLFSAGLDFESKILVKENAPDLLRRELLSPKWAPQVIAISGVTDAYQPIERRLQLTRRCLEVLDRLIGRSEEHTSELQSRGHLVC